MTDRPIIFSAPMVRALLDGRKTMTRRLRWIGRKAADGIGSRETPWQHAKPGDRLWVREGFRICSVGPGPIRGVVYLADDPPSVTLTEGSGKVSLRNMPSIHLPRWASRLTLTVTATKIERLQRISEEDAMAEGVTAILVPPDGGSAPHVEGFMDLWRQLHGADSWDSDPEVVALTFTVAAKNIDRTAP